ncbi:MAG TPA: DNA polymerase III subunit gamma/tau [Candidatus Limnocylindrales bacterium]|nr:DNA polymerase III subunit gamma/tau [Candidatus Limnocylindrales bacterium]
MTDLQLQDPTPAPARQAPAHQALYRRWRSQTFAEVLGQDAVVETLRNAVRTDRVAHAVLFVGPRGTGKTSLARILAKAVNCTNLQDGDPCDACPSCVSIREGRAMDLLEIDAASNRGIDAIRDLRERINYAPTDLKRKVYILDEAHQITKDAWNALLKSLEEPPDFVIFMFASTHPQEFPPAILSRLQRFDVRRLTTDEIEGKLRRILDADGRTATPEAVHLIARLAAGGMRDAESMLDQLMSSSAESLDEMKVRDLLGLADAETVDGFVEALVASDPRAGMRLLDALEDRGRDLRGFLDQVIEALRSGIVGGPPTAGSNAVRNHAINELAGAARRLAAIDPSRAGVGGLRLQLELALFPEPGHAAAPVGAQAAVPAPTRATGASAAPPRPDPAPAPAAPAAPAPAASAGVRTDEPAPAAAKPSRKASEPEAIPPAPARAGTPPAAATAPAPSTSPAPPSSSVAAPEPTGDLATIRDRWAEIVGRVSQHPPTKPLIVVCRPISVEDNVVTLGFPEDKAFLRQVAERRRAILEESVSAVLGRAVAVRCVATNLDVVPELPVGDESAWVLAEARRIFLDEPGDAAEVG